MAVAFLAAPSPALAVSRADSVTPQEAIAAAERTRAVRDIRRTHPEVVPEVRQFVADRLEVRYLYAPEKGVAIDLTPGGEVRRVWHDQKAAWEILRGRPGGVGGIAASVWVWAAFTLAFLIAFADLRRPLSERNRDLAALLSLSVSFAFFNRGYVAAAVLSVYPALAWLGWRSLRVGIGRASRGPVRLNVRVRAMACGLLVLMAARVALDLASPVTLDVAHYALFGADRFAHFDQLYGQTPLPAGNHYGPVVYWAYAPFEALWPYRGQADPFAAHAAGITFDILTVAVMALIGLRMGGRRMAIVFAYGWLALPLTLVALCSHSSDGLVAMLVAAAFLALPRSWLAGAVTAAAGLTKIAPLLLAPLFALHPGIGVSGVARRVLPFATGFGVAAVLILVPVLVNTSPSEFWERVAEAELVKLSPLSIWGLYDPTESSRLGYALQGLVRALAVALALVVAIRPLRRDDVQLAALGVVVLIAIQIPSGYWLLPYITWVLPLALIAFLARFGARAPASA